MRVVAHMIRISQLFQVLSISVAFIFLFPVPSNGQYNNEFDLSKFSSDQLIACFDNENICGAVEGPTTGWLISDELARRGEIHKTLEQYWNEQKSSIRAGIVHFAYHFNNQEVESFMQKIVAMKVDDGEDRYWPVNYLAKKCNSAALMELCSGRYRNQGSLQYETSVELFGKCKYRPAIPYLVNDAIFDSSFNIVGAAVKSLRDLYPDSPKDFERLEDMQRYFCGRAKRDGFRVNCKLK
jgi:hypothetical protein